MLRFLRYLIPINGPDIRRLSMFLRSDPRRHTGPRDSSHGFERSEAILSLRADPECGWYRALMQRRRQELGRVFFAGYRGANRVYRKGFSLLASGAFAEFGSNSVVAPPVRIEGIERIAIGSKVFVDSRCWLHVEGDGQGVAIEIGDDSTIGSYAVFSAVQSIRIGKRVAFGRNVYMSDHSHGFEDAEVPVADQAVTRIRPVEIGDGAWLGENSVLLPGVRIGRGAVIGANSVVNIDVPDGGIAVGVPARVIRIRSADDDKDVGTTTAGASPPVTD